MIHSELKIIYIQSARRHFKHEHAVASFQQSFKINKQSSQHPIILLLWFHINARAGSRIKHALEKQM